MYKIVTKASSKKEWFENICSMCTCASVCFDLLSRYILV